MKSQSSHMPNRPEIPAVLSQLRGRIRRYVFWEGVASVLVVLSLFFWISLAIDYGCSVVFKLELVQGARFLIALAAIGTAAAALITRILARMFRDFRTEALAMVLERRFPQLNDRLITSVQLVERSTERSPLAEQMLNRAVDEVAGLTAGLRLSEVFDFRPLRRAGFAAALLAVSIVMFGIMLPEAFGTWYRRNVILADEYWPRQSELNLVVLAEPGDRERPFQDGLYKHPRGADLTLLATVPDGKEIPESVRLKYRFQERSGGGDGYFSKLGESQFKLTIKGFQHTAELTLTGGDYYNRRPYLVQVVDAPEVDRIVLDSLFPVYTGLNEVNDTGTDYKRTAMAVQGSQVSLPVGTDFLLRVSCSKELTAARIQSSTFNLQLDGDSATLTIPSITEAPDRTIELSPDQLTAEQTDSWLSDDGNSFVIPMVIAGGERPELVDENEKVHLPLRLPVETALLMELTDRDEVISQQPTRLQISGIVDESPIVETRPKGVRNAITRRAIIPIEGQINDDYGVMAARFGYRLDAAEEIQQRPFEAVADGSREFVVEERFEVLDLDLSIGQKLTLWVQAVDGDDVNGPHEQRGEATVFEIVSPDELLSLINSRELNLRQRFEQILQEVRATRTDLDADRGRLRQAAALRENTPAPDEREEVEQKLKELNLSVETVAQRSLLSIRKNANETLAVEESFADIRAELINNGVQTQRMLDRIDNGILKPLNLLNTMHYNQVDESLGLFKLALDRGQDPFGPIDVSIEELDRTIEQIERILAAMLKLQTINEARELLKAILEKQSELKKKTEQERKRKLLESL